MSSPPAFRIQTHLKASPWFPRLQILRDLTVVPIANLCARRYHDDDRALGGEAYRPVEHNGRSPPRGNNYRVERSPPRRGRTPQQYMDTYAPADDRVDRPQSRSNRRRSRSPAFRGRDRGGYRGRPRSPPRTFSPRRDAYVRSPPRARRYSRSPMNGQGRGRSPQPPKRRRDPSPIVDRRLRSPPTVKERVASPLPRDMYERRGYSPPRESRFPRENNYRPAPRERSRSLIRRSEHVSRVASPISSHRSSPHMHPERMAVAGSDTRSPVYPASRGPQVPRSPAYRDRSPPRRAYSPVPRARPRDGLTYRQRSPLPRRRESPPPPRRHEEFHNGTTPSAWSNEQLGAPHGQGYRNGDSRGPPNGPGSHYSEPYPRDQPAGPPSAPISMSAHNRPSSTSLLSAPTRPRGGPGFGRGGSRDAPYGPPRRGGYQTPQHNGPPPRQHNYDSRDGPPAGPRGSYAQDGPETFNSRPHHDSRPPYDSRPSYHDSREFFDSGRPPFRSNNSSSTTYPRTQRFSQHLASVPAIIPGGKLAPSGLDPAAEKRLQQIEEDKKKLLEQIEEKQRVKRQGLREWEKAERESRREGLKSDLAEEHLEKLTGEGTGGTAF